MSATRRKDYYYAFPCGHSRRNNTLPGSKGGCQKCKRQRDADYRATRPKRGPYNIDPNFFRCGHAKSPENSYPSANGYARCHQCKLAGARKHHHAVRDRKAGKLPRVRPNLPRFEIVSVTPIDRSAETTGRSYSLFPEKRRVG
jgi:hypothetical protein